MSCYKLWYDILLQILLLSLLVASSVGYKMFQDVIPNGGLVPNPCKVNYIWQGVGHLVPGGGGVRNQFGLDFYKNGKVCSKFFLIVSLFSPVLY